LEGEAYLVYLCDCLFDGYIFHTIFLIFTSLEKYKKLLDCFEKCESVANSVNSKRVRRRLTTLVISLQILSAMVNYLYYLEVPEYQDSSIFGTLKYIFTLLYETGQVSLDLQFWCLLIVIKEFYKAVHSSLEIKFRCELKLSDCRKCIGRLNEICELTEELLGTALFLNLMLHIFFVWWGILLWLSHFYEVLFWNHVVTDFGFSNYVALALDSTYVFLSFWCATGVSNEVLYHLQFLFFKSLCLFNKLQNIHFFKACKLLTVEVDYF